MRKLFEIADSIPSTGNHDADLLTYKLRNINEATDWFGYETGAHIIQQWLSYAFLYTGTMAYYYKRELEEHLLKAQYTMLDTSTIDDPEFKKEVIKHHMEKSHD